MFFLLFLNIIVDFERPRDDFDYSFDRPFFAFYKSEKSNGFLTHEWNKFKMKYGEDENVVLAEIDCDKQADFCQYQLDNPEKSVILPIRRGNPLLNVHLNNMNDLEQRLQVELNYNRSRTCRLFPDEFFLHPLLIYNTTKDPTIACEEAISLAPDTPKAYKSLYIQKSKNEGLYFDSSFHQFNIIKGEVPNDVMHDAIFEYSMLQLYPVDFERAKKSKRRVALFVTNSVEDLYPYQKEVYLAIETTLIPRISLVDFNDRFRESNFQLMVDELPALSLFSKDFKSCMVLPNFAKEQQNLTKLFLEFSNGDYDDQMLISLDPEEKTDYRAYYYLSLIILSIMIVISFIFTTIKVLLCRKDDINALKLE